MRFFSFQQIQYFLYLFLFPIICADLGLAPAIVLPLVSIQGCCSFPGSINTLGQYKRLRCSWSGLSPGMCSGQIKSGKAPSWIWLSCVSGEYSNAITSLLSIAFFFSPKVFQEFWKIFLWPSSYQKKDRVPWISNFRWKSFVGILLLSCSYFPKRYFYLGSCLKV